MQVLPGSLVQPLCVRPSHNIACGGWFIFFAKSCFTGHTCHPISILVTGRFGAHVRREWETIAWERNQTPQGRCEHAGVSTAADVSCWPVHVAVESRLGAEVPEHSTCIRSFKRDWQASRCFEHCAFPLTVYERSGNTQSLPIMGIFSSFWPLWWVCIGIPWRLKFASSFEVDYLCICLLAKWVFSFVRCSFKSWDLWLNCLSFLYVYCIPDFCWCMEIWI